MAKKEKELSYSELVVKRNELKRKYMDVRFQMVIGHVDNPLQKTSCPEESGAASPPQESRKGEPITQLAHLFETRSEGLLLGRSKSLLELVNTSAGVNKLLLAGEEGMALGADINSQLAALGGSGFHSLAACTTDGANFILGMDSVFHCFKPSFLSI